MEMSRVAAGRLDRRITFQKVTEAQDATGDPVQTWADLIKRWASISPQRGVMAIGQNENVREADMIFVVREDGETLEVAPETFRIVYKSVIYQIVAVRPSVDRSDTLEIMATSRPDMRGARAPIA
jgi:SPP1 family predicted phage head-tail adaptor